MNIAEILAKVAAALGTYFSGQPVTIQFDPWMTSKGLGISFTPGSFNVVGPDGFTFNTPLFDDVLFGMKISAGENSIIVQKP